MKDQIKLKSLQSQETKLRDELSDLGSQIDILSKQAQTKKNPLISIREEIKRYTSDGITVSEHAILRYFERVLGFNIDEIKRGIDTF